MKWRWFLLGLIGFELSSLAAWVWSESSVFFLVVWGLIVLSITWRSVHAGLGLMAVDLLIDPMGRMLAVEVVSGRIVLFGIIILVWLLRHVKFRELFQSRIGLGLCIFLLVVAVGIVRGVAHGYTLSNIVFDANGFAFLFLIPVVLTVGYKPLVHWVMVGYFWLCVKSAFLFTWFSHAARPYFDSGMYQFFRDTRVAELTPLSEQGIRVFLQSHVYSALLLVVLVVGRRWILERMTHHTYILLLASSIGLVMMSLSRSMWLALVVVLIWFVWNINMVRDGLRAFALAVSVLLILFIPYGSMDGFVGMFAGRTAIESEFSAVSRWQMLPQLNELIVQAPLVGYGFGFSTDIVGPAGLMTRTAFEWGWHDLIIKIGLVGLIAFLWFILEIIKAVRNKPLIASLIALILIHIFTPYLNHPLGLGWMIAILYVSNIKKITQLRYFEP